MIQQAEMKDKGFTLIELMVAMVVAIIVTAAIYAVYLSQTRVQVAQEVNLELQESLRATLTIMEREIRTAGADPTGTAGARIITAEPDEFHFTRDIIGGNINGRPSFDGRTNSPSENIRYKIHEVDGFLGRDIEGNDDDDELEELLENVAVLNFVYLDRDGAPTNNRIDIRAVHVTVIAESWQSDRGLLTRNRDSRTYTNAYGDVLLPPQNDTVRRLMLSTNITCRNLAAD